MPITGEQSRRLRVMHERGDHEDTKDERCRLCQHAVAPEDEQMIRNPDEWPCFPFLPIKRSVKGGIEHATIMCHTLDGALPEPVDVIRAGMYDAESFAKAEHAEYTTVGALLNDGWRVD